MKKNPLVDFLAAYGPTASSNNIYDEFVSQQAKKTGCTSLEIDQPLIGEIHNILTSHNPRSIILTGTAGDGKTYIARKVLETLDSEKNWRNTDKTFEINIPNNGRKLTIIKDLSELNKTFKDKIYPNIYDSFQNGNSSLYLICANDGHLLSFFREDRIDRSLYVKIAKMLSDDTRQDGEDRFDIINMSRQSNGNTLLEIIKQITNHPGWKDCIGCPVFDSEQNPCPIRLNLQLLKQDGLDSMQNRLQEMVNLAAFDGNHLSIRQLILLAVNILLGDQKNANITNKELLDCSRAEQRAKHQEYEYTNPYSNVFGSNLSQQAQQNFKVFSALSEFGIGYETNNYFDHGLISKKEPFLPQGFYSDFIFKQKLDQYLENPKKFSKNFRPAIIAQRQRLFFTNNKFSTKDTITNRWNLTNYKWAAEYLNLLAMPNQEGKDFRKFKSKLFMSLNRIMIGELTNTSSDVWIVAPTGIFNGEIGSLLACRMDIRKYGQIYLQIYKSGGYGKPLLIRVEQNQENPKNVDFEITPTFFEYLMRISEGSLPASFPINFQQAVQRFQIKIMALHMDLVGEGHLSSQVECAKGDLQEKPIRVLQ